MILKYLIFLGFEHFHPFFHQTHHFDELLFVKEFDRINNKLEHNLVKIHHIDLLF